MPSRVCAVLACVGLTCSAAATSAAPPAPPALPAAVAADLKDLAALCRDAGGKPRADLAVKRVDLTGDGIDDFVLDVSGIECDGYATAYGDRDKGVMIYVADGKGGATNAYRDSVFGVSLEHQGGVTKLWLTVAGSSCGKRPARDFASENFCDRALRWNPGTHGFAFEPLARARMIR